MTLAQVVLGLVVVAIILLIIAIVIGLVALSSIRANKEETERLRGESVTGAQLATVVKERVAGAVEEVLHYYGLDRQLQGPPTRLGLTATPHNGSGTGYLRPMHYWPNGDGGGQNSWDEPQAPMNPPPPGDGTHHGHSGELPALYRELPVSQVSDHAGARTQLAERAGRPVALRGYEEVEAETSRPYRLLGTQAPKMQGDFYWKTPARRPGDTDVIDAIREPSTPPEFHDREFQRKPDESEEAYNQRVAELTKGYTAWLEAQRLDVTGQIPAITSVPHGAGHDPVGVQGAGTPAR